MCTEPPAYEVELESAPEMATKRARVAILSSFDNIGGAGRAAYRLFNALRESDRADVDMYVAQPWESENTKLWPSKAGYSLIEKAVEKYYVGKNRTSISNTMFSVTAKGTAAPQIDWTDYDVINLHWVDKFFSYKDFQHLAVSGVPIVWTMHDMRAFTGGCHYSFDCTRYRNDCAPCSQLRFDPLYIAHTQLNRRLRIFSTVELVGVTPSGWLAQLARDSRFFADRQVRVIYNSLDLERFSPLDQTRARRQLGLTEECFVMLFAAHDGSEKRKGFALLLEALEECRSDPCFRSFCDAGKILILTLGVPDPRLVDAGLPVQNLGFIKEVDQMVAAYSAADVFVLPSLYDNLPNTMLESLACGTPVLSFDVGGMSEILSQGCGYLVPAYSVSELGATLLRLIKEPAVLPAAAQLCRGIAAKDFAPHKQADAYADLFAQVRR